MNNAAGLTPVECPHCQKRFLGTVAPLRAGESLTCPKCDESIPAETIEAADPTLARILKMLREQDAMRRTSGN